MKKKPISKRKPAAIVVGRNLSHATVVCPGQFGRIRERGFFGQDLETYGFILDDVAASIGADKLKPGQYIRFVQDGGVRKARRVK